MGSNPTLYGYVNDSNSWIDVWGLQSVAPALKEFKVVISANNKYSNFMRNYYDDVLTRYIDELEINYVTISNLSCYIETLSTHFLFVGGKIDFEHLNNRTFIKSNQRDISFDATNFIEGLIEEKICNKDDIIIYIGDNLTENGYEICLNDLSKIMTFLTVEIPQHHYFLFKNLRQVICISFENEIEFGEIAW